MHRQPPRQTDRALDSTLKPERTISSGQQGAQGSRTYITPSRSVHLAPRTALEHDGSKENGPSVPRLPHRPSLTSRRVHPDNPHPTPKPTPTPQKFDLQSWIRQYRAVFPTFVFYFDQIEGNVVVVVERQCRSLGAVRIL